MLTLCHKPRKHSSCVLIKVQVTLSHSDIMKTQNQPKNTHFRLSFKLPSRIANFHSQLSPLPCPTGSLWERQQKWVNLLVEIRGEAMFIVWIRVQAAGLYIMVVESYWNVVQITICVFSALASVVCGYFGQHARGETGRRSVLGREWDDWEPQTSEIPHCRWSALYPLVYFSLPFLASHVEKKNLLIPSDVSSKLWT